MRWLLLIFFLFPMFTSGQVITLAPLDTIIILKADKFIGEDEYHNLYTLKGAVLNKTQKNKTLQYSDIQLGEITAVDIINPLRLTLFYAKFNTAVILDNTLNEITRIEFNQLKDYKNITHARTASDNRLWVFNSNLHQLELYDIKKNRFQQLFTPESDPVLEITSTFNEVWIATTRKIKHYNAYGSLLNEYEIQNIEELITNSGNILAKTAKMLLLKPKNSTIWYPVNLNIENLNSFYLVGEILYIYAKGGLSFYKLNIPKI